MCKKDAEVPRNGGFPNLELNALPGEGGVGMPLDGKPNISTKDKDGCGRYASLTPAENGV